MRIRSRLTLWYFVVSLIILFIFSLGVYWGMEQLLFRGLDQNLKIVADSVEGDYDPATREFKNVDASSAGVNSLFGYYLVISDVLGKPLYKSPIAQQISLDIPSSDYRIKKGEIISVILKRSSQWLHSDPKGEVTFRALKRKMYYRNQQIGWVTVALPIEPIEESRNKLLLVISVGIMVTGLLVGMSGYFLTRKALLPVDRIAKKANKISHNNLNERIDGVTSGDELGALAATLNDLLDRLQRSFQSQRRFLTDAAHELKTPFSILRAHWESELNDPELSLKLKKRLVQDVETISRLTHLINNLLLLSQAEGGQSNFAYEHLRLDKLLREVVADARVLADMKAQRIQWSELADVTIEGDRDRLYQLFFNILDNAVKYTPRGGKIWVSLQWMDPFALVEIRDNGPGIPAEDLPHIFERFYRVQKDRARQTGGSGLGLSISQLIAESHHGAVEVESQLGKGSLFRVKLPGPPQT